MANTYGDKPMKATPATQGFEVTHTPEHEVLDHTNPNDGVVTDEQGQAVPADQADKVKRDEGDEARKERERKSRLAS